MDSSNALVLNDPSKKFNSGQNIEEGLEDRISYLPEPLISHILSFLYADDVVRTSVLSTKWNYIWTNVTTLRFNDRYRHTLFEGRSCNSFFKFVEKTLLLCSPVIQEFHLNCSTYYSESHVKSWISAVIRRNVRTIDIRIMTMTEEDMVLPRCLCNSASLIELRLEMPCIVNVPSSICFPALKILRLCGVMFLNVYSFHSSEIQLTFPVLEELHIFRSAWRKVKVVNIEAPKLTIFSLDYCYDPAVILAAFKLHRSSPEKFCYGGFIHIFVDCVLPNPSSVLYADFNISIRDLDERHKMCSLIFKLLGQFSSLKYLKLSCKDIEAIASVEDLQERLPTMDNVMKLTIRKQTPALDGTLIALLHSLPVLETLVFNWGTPRFYGDEMVPEAMPLCLQNRLKIVEIECYNETDNGLELAKFLLKNAMVLEEMRITPNIFLMCRAESELVAIKGKFLAFPRSSAHASIYVNIWTWGLHGSMVMKWC